MPAIPEVIGTLGVGAVAIGTLLEGETVLVLAGVAAAQGYLPLGGVIAAAFCGGFANDQLFFFLGRRFAGRMLHRKPEWERAIVRVQQLLERHPSLFIFGFRFFYGLRTLSPLVIATTKVATARFVLLNGLAAAVWAALYGTLGYLFGTAAEAAVKRVQASQQLLLVLGAALALGFLLLRRWRRRRARRAPQASSSRR